MGREHETVCDQRATPTACAGADGIHRFENHLSFSTGGKFGAYVQWGDYSGIHHYTCPACASVNQDFTQSTGDNKNGVTWGASALAALGYSPSRATEWSIRFDYGYLGNGLALRNKMLTSDPTPHLVNGSTQSWDVMLAVRYSL